MLEHELLTHADGHLAAQGIGIGHGRPSMTLGHPEASSLKGRLPQHSSPRRWLVARAKGLEPRLLRLKPELLGLDKIQKNWQREIVSSYAVNKPALIGEIVNGQNHITAVVMDMHPFVEVSSRISSTPSAGAERRHTSQTAPASPHASFVELPGAAASLFA